MRWALRHRRTWLAVAAAAVAPLLASRDNRTGWTVLVAVVTSSLAAASVWVDYAAAHPDRPGRRAALERERVRAILYAYEQTGARRLTRDDRRRLREQAEVARVLRRYEQRGSRRPVREERPGGRDAKQQARVEAVLARYERGSR